MTDSPDRIPEAHYREDLLVPWVNLFVGSIVFGVLFALGLVLFILPGLFVLTGLVFFGARIAAEDENFVAGMGSSWRLTRGNRIGVFLLLLAVLVVLIGISIVFAIVAVPVVLVSRRSAASSKSPGRPLEPCTSRRRSPGRTCN